MCLTGMLVSPWEDDEKEAGGRDKEQQEGKIESLGVSLQAVY